MVECAVAKNHYLPVLRRGRPKLDKDWIGRYSKTHIVMSLVWGNA